MLAVVAGVLGLMVGSFLNVVIYRLPVMMRREWRAQSRELLDENETVIAGRTAEPSAEEHGETFNLVTPRSRCPACGKNIKGHQNVPVVSYLFLKGRCAACGVRISVRYPTVEALSGIVSALVAIRFGYTIECAGALALTWSLIALSFIDFDEQLLPDSITLPLLWLGLVLNLLAYAPDSLLFVGPEAAITGAVVGYLSLWSVYWGFKVLTGKEGMGYGDFKLLAALGAWLGWKMVLLVIMLSAIVGVIAALGMIVFRGHDREIPIPFGPYIAVAGFVAMLWGRQLIELYIRVSGLH